MFDKLHEECGIFGIAGSKDAANMTYLGLYALQHRGQEATGIVSSDGKNFYQEKGVGLVSDLFNKERLGNLKGTLAIGHNRYSTTGENHLKNVQPIMVNFALGMLALAHNGNLTNAAFLRDELEAYGAIFQSTSDSEVIIHLIAQSRQKDIMARLTEALHRVKGAYSLVILTEQGLIAARDPYGLRPLSLGRTKDAWVLASETCAFDLIDADYVRDVEPGELILINQDELTSYKPFPKIDPAFCVFEYVYFSRPDSRVYDHNVYEIRKNLGRQLARETMVPADIVIPVPDSGVPAALGYAEAGNLRYETGLIRNHYVGRTFIEPEQAIRHFGVKIKLNAVA
ncbi:MAG TPA: amidophosphoribosyltransferase, partial [Nitrospiria bacterium]